MSAGKHPDVLPYPPLIAATISSVERMRPIHGNMYPCSGRCLAVGALIHYAPDRRVAREGRNDAH